MTPPVSSELMTTEQLLSLPDDGVERWLIAGELREGTMTVRNRNHSKVLAKVTYYLEAWNERQSEPHGEVLCGEAGVKLQGDPDTTVGVDVLYVGPERVAAQNDSTSLLSGPPLLAVEVLSPNDTQKDIAEKVQCYLAHGVRAVWVVDPDFDTIRVLQPGETPIYFNRDQVLTGDPYLPGFSVPVAKLFR